MGVNTKIDVNAKNLKTIKVLLDRYLPNTTIWAFGSRVKFTTKKNSDLDLVAFIQPIQEIQLCDLKEALAESNLPFKVDLLNWNDVPDNFKKNIEAEYFIIQDTNRKKVSLPNGWKTYKLSEFADINPKVPLKAGTKYPFVEMKDLEPSLKYVKPSENKEFKSGSKFENEDTLFARITPCLENGKISQVKDLENGIGFGSTEFMVFRGKKDLSDTDYVYYLTRTDFVRDNAIQAMTGTSGRQRVEKSAIEELEIIAPNLTTQRSIASILSSLDDKIELNLQMNQTLENMAQTIFKEWFVNFNFPGFDGELVNGLPKGWKNGSIYDIAEVIYGFPFKSTYFNKNKEGKGVIRIRDLKNNKCGQFTEENADKKYLIIAGDVLAGMDAEFIPSIWYGETSWLNQRVCKFKPKTDFIQELFVYYSIKPLLEKSQYGKVGTTVIHLGKSDIDNYEIVIPDKLVLKKIFQLYEPIHKKLIEIEQEKRNLTQIRDGLLPKLMSGKIEVN